MYVSYVKIHMFTAGADVLGCYKSDRLWFLLNGRNQSLSYLPSCTSVGSCCQHMSKEFTFGHDDQKLNLSLQDTSGHRDQKCLFLSADQYSGFRGNPKVNSLAGQRYCRVKCMQLYAYPVYFAVQLRRTKSLVRDCRQNGWNP